MLLEVDGILEYSIKKKNKNPDIGLIITDRSAGKRDFSGEPLFFARMDRKIHSE